MCDEPNANSFENARGKVLTSQIDGNATMDLQL